MLLHTRTRTHIDGVRACRRVRWDEFGVSDCVRMSAKQSISLPGDSSWSHGQYRMVGKLDVTAVPPRRLLDMDLHTHTCATRRDKTPTQNVLQGPGIISGAENYGENLNCQTVTFEKQKHKSPVLTIEIATPVFKRK